MATKPTAAPQADPPGPPSPPPGNPNPPGPPPHTPPPIEPPGRPTPLAPLELHALRNYVIACKDEADTMLAELLQAYVDDPVKTAAALATRARLRKATTQLAWLAGLPFGDMPS